MRESKPTRSGQLSWRMVEGMAKRNRERSRGALPRASWSKRRLRQRLRALHREGPVVVERELDPGQKELGGDDVEVEREPAEAQAVVVVVLLQKTEEP